MKPEKNGRTVNPIHVNNLEIRLAETEREVAASQALRFNVFCREMGAKMTPMMELSELDFDPYDAFCDHLLVIDRERGTPLTPYVVGSYRLLRGEVADENNGFYSEAEFDLTALIKRTPQVLELGRSCIDAEYRSRGTLQLLWRGLAEYVFKNSIKYLFGCASFPGTNLETMRLPLAYLHHHHLATKTIRPYALHERHVEMNMMAKDQIDVGQALRELPPLIKGYLRAGGVVGDGAVIDYDFNTVDVSIVMETANITRKYLHHYSRHSQNAPASHRVPDGVQDVAA